MKAISLWQPWASLIACGAKPYETRNWAPPISLIGQPIAIHAAKTVDRDAARFAEDLMYGQHKSGGFELADKLAASMRSTPVELMGAFGEACMPVGCVVGIARLEGAFLLGERAESFPVPAARVVRAHSSQPVPGAFVVEIDDFGDYRPGRWAWLLRGAKPLHPPVKMTGRQRVFDLPQGWLTERVAHA